MRPRMDRLSRVVARSERARGPVITQAFELGLTEIEKARVVGERALKAIELAEHGERFNIHAALLNLEKAHGDEASLAAAVGRALHGCDPKAVYMHVASMHERARDYMLADGAHEICCRKYRSQPDVWLAWITARSMPTPRREPENRALPLAATFMNACSTRTVADSEPWRAV